MWKQVMCYHYKLENSLNSFVMCEYSNTFYAVKFIKALYLSCRREDDAAIELRDVEVVWVWKLNFCHTKRTRIPLPSLCSQGSTPFLCEFRSGCSKLCKVSSQSVGDLELSAFRRFDLSWVCNSSKFIFTLTLQNTFSNIKYKNSRKQNIKIKNFFTLEKCHGNIIFKADPVCNYISVFFSFFAVTTQVQLF